VESGDKTMARQNVFILEDDYNRLDFFKDKLKDTYYKIFHADNVEEAKLLFLSNNFYDAIFLDHDLGNQTFVDSSEKNTGYQFAKFIKSLYASKEFSYNKIIIHSMNPTGSQNIKRELDGLKNVMQIPYSELKKILKG